MTVHRDYQLIELALNVAARRLATGDIKVLLDDAEQVLSWIDRQMGVKAQRDPLRRTETIE
jgi:hypothetical protein